LPHSVRNQERKLSANGDAAVAEEGQRNEEKERNEQEEIVSKARKEFQYFT
jgi:hypothetical protein